jgi:MFS transporter, DHA1 family, inner membrane transport protein
MSSAPAQASSRAIFPLLAFANFAVGMGAFVVVGVLTPVATAFAISSADAGWMMTAYALVYTVASPILVALSGKVDRQRVLTAGLVLFLMGALLAALAPTYSILLVARMVMALGGGLVTPVIATIAVAMSSPETRGAVLSRVFFGLTLSQVIGVPVGAWLGYALGWQSAFVIVSVLTALSLVLIIRSLPRGIVTPSASLASLSALLVTPRLVLAVLFTALFIGGIYVVYTFLGPFLETRLGLGRDGVTAMLVLFGLGAVAGNVMGGFLTDRIGPKATLLWLCGAQILLMPVITVFVSSLVMAAVLMTMWSVFGWSFMVAQQARLATLDPERTPLLLALNASALYLGGSIGSLVGGLMLQAQGYAMLGVAGAAMMVLAALSLFAVERLGKVR